MPWTVTIDGKTFTSENLKGNAYADEVSGFPGMLSAFASEAESIRGEASFFKGAGNLSTTPVTPHGGEIAFTTGEEPAFEAGAKVRVTSASVPTHWMIGTVVALDGHVINIDVQMWEGAEQKADWVLTYPVSVSYMPIASGTMTGPIDMDTHGLFVDLIGMKVADLGAISGAVTIGMDQPMELRGTLVGDATLSFPPPAPDHTMTWVLKITQGEPGGFVATFAVTAWLGDEVDWAAQTTDTETMVAVRLDEDGNSYAWAVGGF